MIIFKCLVLHISLYSISNLTHSNNFIKHRAWSSEQMRLTTSSILQNYSKVFTDTCFLKETPKNILTVSLLKINSINNEKVTLIDITRVIKPTEFFRKVMSLKYQFQIQSTHLHHSRCKADNFEHTSARKKNILHIGIGVFQVHNEMSLNTLF